MTGHIKTIVLAQGFAFIHGDDQLDYFAHTSAFDRLEWVDLVVGARVTFMPMMSDKGLRAEAVRVMIPAAG